MRPNKMMQLVPPCWVIILLSVILWGGEFLRRGLWEPDEVRYAYVAREMMEGSHWFVPHINGKPYPDKPPLMFWLINASSFLTGGRINGVSARLPSLFGSILTLWATTRLLARWHGAQSAWRAVFVLLTSYLFWHQGAWGQIDALLCGLIMISVYCFFTYADSLNIWRILLAYIFAGFAVLAKGPVGFIIPVGIYLTSILISRQKAELKRFHWIWGSLAALVIPGLWLLLAWHMGAPSDYFARMFGEKSFGRAIASVGHDHPFHFYLWHFPLEFMPWTIFMAATWNTQTDKPLRARLAGWLIFVIGLFSLFVCKRIEYILPAYPAASMLIAIGWDRSVNIRKKRWAEIATTVFLWSIGIAEATAVLIPNIGPIVGMTLIPCSVILMAGGIAATAVLNREGSTPRLFWIFAITLFVHHSVVSTFVFPAFNRTKMPPAEILEEVKTRRGPEQPVYLYKHQLAILPFYTERPGRELNSIEELQTVISEQPDAVIFFSEKQWNETQSQVKEAVAVKTFNMGNKRLVFVARI